jgi:gluconolactonase
MAAELDKLVDGVPEKIVGGFTLTAGPVFSRIGYLLFAEISSQRIMKWSRGTVAVFRENSNSANALTFDHQGRLLVCESGRVTRQEKDGKITTLAQKGLHRPVDLAYSIDGSVYFCDVVPEGVVGKSPVYQITRKGELRVASEECQSPRGVALAPNQLKLYVVDGGARIPNVRVFDVAGDGALRNGRVFAELQPNLVGFRAGLKTDESGNVWVAAAGGILVFDPSGERLGTVPVPETPSNCCWGEGFRNLYITARTSVYKLQTKVNGTRTY